MHCHFKLFMHFVSWRWMRLKMLQSPFDIMVRRCEGRILQCQFNLAVVSGQKDNILGCYQMPRRAWSNYMIICIGFYKKGNHPRPLKTSPMSQTRGEWWHTPSARQWHNHSTTLARDPVLCRRSKPCMRSSTIHCQDLRDYLVIIAWVTYYKLASAQIDFMGSTLIIHLRETTGI